MLLHRPALTAKLVAIETTHSNADVDFDMIEERARRRAERLEVDGRADALGIDFEL